MEHVTCQACGSQVRLDAQHGRPVCARCGQPVGQRSQLVGGVEVIDWFGAQVVSRYYLAVEPSVPRSPSTIYLRVLRRVFGDEPRRRPRRREA